MHFKNFEYFSNHFITILYKPWISLNFFFFFVPKAFWSFLVFQTLKTCAIHLFILFSLCQKEFAKDWPSEFFLCLSSPFSKRTKDYPPVFFCVSLLPCQRIQNETVWEFFWFFPFPYTKVFKGLTAWEFFCIPIHKVSKV